MSVFLSRSRIIVAALAMCAAVTGTVLLQCRSTLRQERAVALRRLGSLADQQADMTADWIEDARIDLRACRAFEHSNGEALAAYQAVIKRADYVWIQYVDPTGRRVAGAFREAGPKDPPDAGAVTAALKSADGTVEFHDDPEKSRTVVDVSLPEREGGRTVGALFLRMDPRRNLFRHLGSARTFSATFESVLARRDGDSIVFLSDPGQKHPARVPISTPRLAAAKALRGEAFDGSEVDSRGVRVLAVARRVAGTDWMTIAKVDDAEVSGPILLRALTREAVFLALFLLVTAGFLRSYRSQEEQHLEEEFASKREIIEKTRLLDAFYRHLPTPLAFMDRDFDYLRVNEAYAAACGRPASEFPGRNHFELCPDPEDEGLFRQVVRTKTSYRAEAKPFEFPGRAPGAAAYCDWTLVPLLDASGEVDALVLSLVDASERVRTQAELRRHAAELDGIYNKAPCAYHSLGEDGTILRINDTELEWLGYRREEVVGLRKFAEFVTPTSQKTFRSEFPVLKERGWIRDVELELARKDGSILPVLVSATVLADEAGRFLMTNTTMYDMTERKRAAEANARLAAMIEGSDDAIVGENLDGVIVSWNEGAHKLYGWTAAEAVGERVQMLLPPGEPDDILEILSKVRRGEPVAHYETNRRGKDNRVMRVSLTVSPVKSDGAIVGASSVARDVTERWAAERAVAKLSRALRTLSLCNEALVHAKKEDELLARICRLIVEQGGHRLAWVGYRVDDDAKAVRPVAQAGYEEGYLEGLEITWADSERGRGPTGTAIRAGTIELCRDVLAEARMEPWRGEALKRGYRSSLSLPLRSNGGTIGALMIYSAEPDAFSTEEIALLKELSEDLAFGIMTLRARAARDAAEEGMRRTEADLSRAQAVAHIGSWSLDVPKNALLWSDETHRLFGVPAGTPLTYELFLEKIHPDDRAAVNAAWTAALERKPYDIEHRIQADGAEKWVRERAEVEFGPDGAALRGIGTVQDITERKKAELALAKLARALRALSRCNEALVRAKGEQELLDRICRLVVDEGGYPHAWVGYRVDDAAKSVRPAAHACQAESCHQEGDLAALGLTWADADRGRGPMASAIRGEGASFSRDVRTDPAFAPWREDALKRGYRSVAALPLAANGSSLGALMIYADEADAFSGEEVALLKELTEDLAFGIVALRARDARDAAEKALRHASVYNRSLIEASLDPLVTIGANGRIMDVNVATEEATGRTRAELIGTDFSSYFTEPSQARAGYEKAFREGQVRDYPLEMLARDGSAIPVLYNATVYRDKDGTVLGVFAAARDVSERRRAEKEREQFFRFFRTSADLMCIADPQGAFMRTNPAFTEALGYSEAELVSKPFIDFVVPEDKQATVDEMARQMKLGHSLNFENRYLCRDGSVKWLSWRAIYDKDDGVTYATARDMTDYKRLQTQMLQAQKMESVGILAGGVAHDFNNILMTIMGNCSFLLASLAPDDPRRADVEEIKAAEERAAALTRQLLIFSRKQKAQAVVVDVNALVLNLQKMLRRILGEDVSLEISPCPEPALVRADPGQLEQVLMNLAVNSRDAMRHGGRLIVRIECVQPGGPCHDDCRPGVTGSVRLTVEDTGTGMPPEVQAHLFEPFFTTKAAGKGTGLGLSTVYGIVRQAGGGVAARSEVGKGTTFTIDLPRSAAGAAPEAAEPPPAEPRGRETILLVEDDEILRRIDLRLLVERGYRVLPASNGEEALALLHDGGKKAELLLTDVVMPGIGGGELVTEALKINPDLKVIFVSGYTGHGAFDQLQTKFEFLQKPVSPEVLARKVREVLDRKSSA